MVHFHFLKMHCKSHFFPLIFKNHIFTSFVVLVLKRMLCLRIGMFPHWYFLKNLRDSKNEQPLNNFIVTNLS